MRGNKLEIVPKLWGTIYLVQVIEKCSNGYIDYERRATVSWHFKFQKAVNALNEYKEVSQ